MTALALFVATFVLVFALGLQSLNVNKGQYAWAFFTSLVIGSMQMVMLKLGPDASWLEIAGYLSGGPLGIVTAMRIQPWLTRPRAPRRLNFPPKRSPVPAEPAINRVTFYGDKKS